MGYTTDFNGQFTIDKVVDDETYALINGLAQTRRMKRNIEGYGVEGEFYFNPDDLDGFGQTHDDTIIDYNEPPMTQPSLWLKWHITEDKQHIEWTGEEKFYGYVEWMEYLINKILKPRGYVVNGEVEFQGEDQDDYGFVIVKDNVVSLSGDNDQEEQKENTLGIALIGDKMNTKQYLNEFVIPMSTLHNLKLIDTSFNTSSVVLLKGDLETLKKIKVQLENTSLQRFGNDICTAKCVIS